MTMTTLPSTELEGIDSPEFRVLSDDEIEFVSGGLDVGTVGDGSDEARRRAPRIAFWVDGIPVYRLV